MPARRKKVQRESLPIEGMEFDEIVTAIQAVSSASLRAISEAGLSERALILLLHDSTGVPKRHIKLILEALPELEERYLRGEDG